MGRELVDDYLGEGDRSNRCRGLRRRQERRRSGQRRQLSIDGQGTAQEVDPIDRQSEALALSPLLRGPCNACVNRRVIAVGPCAGRERT